VSRDAHQRFNDILAAIERCRQYRHRLDDSDGSIAAMAYDAILRNLAVIGEAVRSLPDEIKRPNRQRGGRASPDFATSSSTSTSASTAT
jgi:uncharacterized protein with HEPN domain